MFRWSTGIAIRMLKKPCKSLGVLRHGRAGAAKGKHEPKEGGEEGGRVWKGRWKESCERAPVQPQPAAATTAADVVYATVVTHRLQRGLDYNAKRMLAKDPPTPPLPLFKSLKAQTG